MIKFNHQYFRFKPSLLGVLITLICIPMFIKFGLWQYGKAEVKMDIQEAYKASLNGQAADFPLDVISLESDAKDDWAYRHVALKGVYDTRYQFLLDNKVENTRPGYHVITPLKITDTEQYVLVNRGWIPANDLHTDIPIVVTPKEEVNIDGQIWVPSTKIFTLESEAQIASKNFEKVWQHINLKKYKEIVPIKVSALMIKLDASNLAGGFVRNWQVPVDRIAKHMSYAYQWYGFAAATLLIFLYSSFVPVRDKKEK